MLYFEFLVITIYAVAGWYYLMESDYWMSVFCVLVSWFIILSVNLEHCYEFWYNCI